MKCQPTKKLTCYPKFVFLTQCNELAQCYCGVLGFIVDGPVDGAVYCKYVKVLDIYPMIMGHNIDIHCILRTTI